ncbi:MAG: zf-TFIIB domain-containing protein, partial [Micromonosporaceae bacterium]
MRTYNRNGVHIEQCDSCRGIFLDYGELEHLNQMEGHYAQPPPAAGYGAPGWGHHGHGHHKQRGFGRML